MKKKQILTRDAVPGMICAEDVHTASNHLIIAKHAPLTDRIITRLKFYTIESIYILAEEEDTKEEPPEPAVKEEETYTDYIRNSKEFVEFNHSFSSSLDDFKGSLNMIVTQNKEVDTNELLTQTDHILEKSRNGFHVLSMLHRMRDSDDLTYVHSLNVALICNIMGRWLEFSEEDTATLTLCGLLHDVGKLAVPQDVLTKPAKLLRSEYTTIKQHAVKGYEILKDKNIDEHVKNAALMHHERCDGSGYPSGLTSNKIDDFAKIVSIVDVYDAMTSPRTYRGPLCPFEVIDVFESEGLQKYDPRYITTFLSEVVQTYINNEVLLNNGIRAKVVMINQHYLSKPVVETENNRFIDLSKYKNLSIAKLL